MKAERTHPRHAAAWAAVTALAMLIMLLPGASGTLADGGDFSLDFRAAAPFSYTHTTGGGAWNDGTNNEYGDTREELEGGQFACEDVVTYLTQIVVGASPTAPIQTIQLDYSFLADTTGQPGVAHVDVIDTSVAINYGQVENGDDGTGDHLGPGNFGLDSGISDDRQTIAGGDTGVGGSTATIVSETFDPPGTVPFGSPPAKELLLSVQVDDLEAGETVILRIDVRIACDPGSSPTGNLQAKLQAGRVVSPAPDAIPGGAQTIPFKQIGNLAFETDYAIEKTCPTGVEGGESFDYQLIVSNFGPITATSLQVTDVLPTGVTYVSATPDAGTCSETAGTVTCTLAELAVSDTWSIAIRVTAIQSTGSVINSASVTDTDTKLTDTDSTNNLDECTTAVPVTLSYFQATPSGNVVDFDWSTATEFGNVGFNLYVQTDAGRQRINGELIPSHTVDSVIPQTYSFQTASAGGELFFIEDVDIWSRGKLHGPFELGKAYGARVVMEPIDWVTVHAEHSIKEAKRAAEVTASANGILRALAAQPSVETPLKPRLSAAEHKVFLPSTVRNTNFSDNPRPRLKPEVQVDLLVDRTGLHRVTYEDLLAMGLDLMGIKSSDFALTNRGEPVSIHVASDTMFGPGAYFEFYGEALDTLYTGTNVYTLQIERRLASRVAVDTTPPDASKQPVPFYMETVTVDRDRAYSFVTPNGDPWYDTRLLAFSHKSWVFDLGVDHYVAGAQPATLSVDMWGWTDWPLSPDHHVLVLLNDTLLADERFDGFANYPVSVQLPPALLIEGKNALTLTLPADTGARWDMVALDGYGITYPRAFVAREGSLTFTAAGEIFRVQGLPTADVLVYRLSDQGPVKLESVLVEGSEGTYSARFAGSGELATYVISAVESILTPTIQQPRLKTDITSGPAQYLVISHPDFIDDLTPLIQARQDEGLQVRVVDVDDIYAQFSFGIFDAAAIHDYVTYAANRMDTEYVLLVGGDTYDYRDYLGQGSMSFIPSLYAATDQDGVSFAPVDPLYADANGDWVPDLAIGRFPVRSSAELDWMIAKTLAFASKDYALSSVFAADDGFSGDSDAFIGDMPGGWTIQRAYVGELGVSAARSVLLGALNDGVALTSYVGHSGPAVWTFDGLFNGADAAALTNHGRPTVVSQWGCWNTYYVDPAYNTLAHKFLLSGDQGAVAVLGATAISYGTSERALGQLMIPRMAEPGVTIGSAMQSAKAELAIGQPGLLDVLLGWTILGDPALVVQP